MSSTATLLGQPAFTSTSLLRRLPTRDAQPPFDDARDDTRDVARNGTSDVTCEGVVGHRQDALALAFALPGGLPAVPALPDVLHAPPAVLHAASDALHAPLPRRAGRDNTDEEFGPQQTPRVLLPEPTPWAGRLVQAVIEVVSGARPPSQLVRWTTAAVYDSVQRRLQSVLTEPRPVLPLRLAEVVRSVRVSEPIDGVAEVCAIVQQGPRCRAIALRLEGVDGRWQCTALQIG